MPRPIVLAGPSGTGKSTLIKKLQAEFPDKFGFSVSHTSRAPRPGEEDGVHYHFRAKETIEAEVAAGKFIESATYAGNMYGTSIAAVQQVAAAGRVCVLDIDCQGVRSVHKAVPSLNARYVFVAPPSIDVLEKRLRGRGDTADDAIAKRLATAASEMAQKDEPGMFDRVLVNDDLDQCYAQLKQFIDETAGDDASEASAASAAAAAADDGGEKKSE